MKTRINKRDKKLKDISELGILITKFIFNLFVGLCFLMLFALLTILVKDLIVGEVNQFHNFLKWISLLLIVLVVLLFINRNFIIKVFENIAFGKFRGIPIGMVIIGLFLYTVVDAFLLLLFNIHSNSVLQVINFLVCMIISVPLYGFLSFWYFEKKNK